MYVAFEAYRGAKILIAGSTLSNGWAVRVGWIAWKGEQEQSWNGVYKRRGCLRLASAIPVPNAASVIPADASCFNASNRRLCSALGNDGRSRSVVRIMCFAVWLRVVPSTCSGKMVLPPTSLFSLYDLTINRLTVGNARSYFSRSVAIGPAGECGKNVVPNVCRQYLRC